MGRKGIANDPDRKTRIAEAALELMAAGGVRAVTHRRVAAHAGVPLGSVSYHFIDLDDIIASAFELFARQAESRYNDVLAGAGSDREALELLVDLICGQRRATERELRLGREMYAYGSQSTRVSALIRTQQERSLDVLRTHFPDPAARAVDALVEGWWIYQSWTPEVLTESTVRTAIHALANAFSTAAEPTQERRAR